MAILSRLHWLLLPISFSLLNGCAGTPPDALRQQLDRLLPADALLLGEQHDAPDHQRIAREVVQQLAARGQLAALALEMAEQGRSTAALARDAGEAEVRAALQWDAAAWPWAAYGPSVMAAVRAGVPVLGANLPRAQMRERMNDTQLDARLPPAALRTQQERIRAGHCGALPEARIAPMVRVQIARDLAMAQTLRDAARAGRTVVLLAGRGHVDRTVGVPQHLPPGLRVIAVGLGEEEAPATNAQAMALDTVWPAAPGPEVDHCAPFKVDKVRDDSDTR